MKMRFAAVAGALLVVGCGVTPGPQFYQGRYYITGDANCKFLRGVGPDVVQCFDGKDRPTEMRRALSGQELVAYHQARNALVANQPQLAPIQPMQQIVYPNMQTPQVAPIGRPGGSQVRCIGVGIYANCRAY